MDSAERKAFGLLALLLLATAYTSYGYFELDEHFQVLEFAGTKLGIVPVRSLPWEYEAQIRPWLQPAIFAGICKALGFIGLTDRFLWTFVFRLLCAASGFWAMWSVYRVGSRWFPDRRARRFHLLLCTTLGFLPYLLVRTSSENLSATYFIIGASLLLLRLDFSTGACAAIPNRALFAAGILMGLAFQFRYQVIFMIGGLGLWLVVYAGIRWKGILAASAGFLPVFAAGLAADWYGYGKFTFAFWNYFRVNLLEGKTADFGAEPFYAYVYLTLAHFFAPVALILVAATVVFWVRNPRHVLTWTTLPLFLFHCFIGHKEVRFLFPLIPPALLILTAVFFRDGGLVLPQFFRKPFWKRAFRWVCVYNWAFLALFCVYPFCVESHIKHQKFIYEHRGSAGVYYAVGYNPYRRNELTYSFYRPGALEAVEAADLAELASIAERRPDEDLYFFAPMPYLEDLPESLAGRTSLLNPSHFFFRWPWMLQFSTPILKGLHRRFDEVQCPSLFRISARVPGQRSAPGGG